LVLLWFIGLLIAYKIISDFVSGDQDVIDMYENLRFIEYEYIFDV
jgi:hypothetical protein